MTLKCEIIVLTRFFEDSLEERIGQSREDMMGVVSRLSSNDRTAAGNLAIKGALKDVNPHLLKTRSLTCRLPGAVIDPTSNKFLTHLWKDAKRRAHQRATSFF